VPRDLLADDVEEVVGAGVAEEAELALQVGDGLVEAAVRAEVAAEAVVFAVEFEQRLGVVDGALELARLRSHVGRP
jgi:hypothetical protein